MVGPGYTELLVGFTLLVVGCLGIPVILLIGIAMSTARRKHGDPPPAALLINCPNCNRALSQPAKSCPSCGHLLFYDE